MISPKQSAALLTMIEDHMRTLGVWRDAAQAGRATAPTFAQLNAFADEFKSDVAKIATDEAP